MKGFKQYSIIGIGLSVLTFLLSFFMVDLLPMLYKLYTGNTIDPSKITKLLDFGSSIISDLKIYSIFGLLTFIVMYFLKNYKQYFIFLAIALLIHFIFIAEIGEFTVFRRLYQLVVMLPLLWMFFEYFKFRNQSYYQKITHGFLYISLLCIVLPGAYFPPFFNGIAGWTAQIDKIQPVSVGGCF